MFKTLQVGTDPRDALREAQQRAGVIRVNAEFMRDQARVSGLSAGVIIGKGMSDFQEHRARLAALASTPGMTDLSISVGFDVDAGMRELIDACDAVLAWIATGLPVDGDGWLLVWRFEDGKMTPRTLTPEQCSGLIDALDALIKVIN